MAGLNEKLETAKRRLALYYRAEAAILTGQEYAMGSKKLRRADLADVQGMIKRLEMEVESLEHSGKNRTARAVPLDI